MSPDELILDNLRCIPSSDPMDVITKRRHTDLMGEYVDKYLIERGVSDSMRNVTRAAVRQFYLTNDSPLFGHFKQARASGVHWLDSSPSPGHRHESL